MSHDDSNRRAHGPRSEDTFQAYGAPKAHVGLIAGHVDIPFVTPVVPPAAPPAVTPRAFTPGPPFLYIDCGQTIEADVVPTSVASFWRTNALGTNEQYYSRYVLFRVDTRKHVRFELTSNFKAYMIMERFDQKRWTTADGVFDMQIESDFTGPFGIEVTTIQPFVTGHFSLKMICDVPVVGNLITGYEWPGTVGFVYATYWGPRVSATPTDNLLAPPGDAFQYGLTDDGVNPVPPPPYDWTVTDGSLPPGVTLHDDDPSDWLVQAHGTPTAVGTYTGTIVATNPTTGEVQGSGPMNPFIVDKLFLPDLAKPNFFTGLWGYAASQEWFNDYDRRFILILPGFNGVGSPLNGGIDLTGLYAQAALYAPDGFSTFPAMEPSMYILVLLDVTDAQDRSQLGLWLLPTTSGVTDWAVRWTKAGPDWVGDYKEPTNFNTGDPYHAGDYVPDYLNPPQTVTIARS